MKAKNRTVPAGIKFSSDDRILMSSAKCAEFFNVSDWTIRDWGGKGCPQEERGWWDVKAIMIWLGKGKPADDDALSNEARKLKAEADLKEEQAKKAIFENAILREQYFEKSLVEQEWSMRIIELKNSLLSLSKKISSTITDPDVRIEIEKIISEEVYSFLDQYARQGKYTPKRNRKRGTK